MPNKIEKLKTALLNYIPIGKAIYLANDIFLTNYLDGSDKIYGFTNEEGEILVEAGCFSRYPINNIDTDDINYIMESDIYNKIINKQYPLINENEL